MRGHGTLFAEALPGPWHGATSARAYIHWRAMMRKTLIASAVAVAFGTMSSAFANPVNNNSSSSSR